MKLNRINIFLATIFLSHHSVAAIKTYENTWFEIEVILFSQLGDKSRLKEVFPDSSSLPKYPRVIDLLGPYLQPNILTLKQQLPYCQDGEYPLSLIDQASNLPSLFSQRSLKEIADSIDGNPVNDIDNNSLIEQQTLNNGQYQSSADDNVFIIEEDLAGKLNKSLDDNNQEISDSTLLQEKYLLNSIRQKTGVAQTIETVSIETLADNQESNNDLFAQTLSIPITVEQMALVAQAEQEFSPIQFDYSPQPFAEELCAIPPSTFNDYQPTQKNFSYTGFPVDSIGLTVDGAENDTETQAYLISKDSLKLSNIVRQLRRSRDFKPLLHLGWRQITKLKKLAIPVHLFAGDNLDYHYQQSLHLYQQQLKESQQQEQVISNILSIDQQTVQLTIEEQAIQERINSIVEHANLDDKVLTQILSELDVNALALKNNDTLMLAKEPLPPIQSWSIEGFLKVEVERYLHITADFNVVDTSLSEQATNRLQPGNELTVKSIRFQQNKRVRSNEIHYFDHPYMGMIVQIRRHERVEPEDNEIDE